MDLVILVRARGASRRSSCTSVRPALHGAAERHERLRAAPVRALDGGLAGRRGRARALDAQRLRVLAPPICLLYAFGYSFIAFDQVMSLEPTWYSNLFGAYFAWGGFLSAVSATALLSVLYRHDPGLEGEITQRAACTTSAR